MPADVNDELIEFIAQYDADPVGFAQVAWEWGEGDLSEDDGPRAWQNEVLGEIRDHLSNPDTRFEPLLLAVASGHGIGKSSLIGMVADWALSTCDDCKIVCTANTDNQLRTKTAPEVGKWFRSSLTAGWFNVTATAIYSVDKAHDRTWRMDFIPWSESNPEAFAGLHNKGKRIVVIFDEASSIPDKIWEVIEGAMTDEGTEIIWLAFGNPTRNIGRFRECFRKFRHRWKVRQIDSRTVKGTNARKIQQWLEDYGEDSDFFKVRVRGMFPSSSARQFISTDDVDAARGRVLRPEQYSFAPKIIGVDPAWTGDDEFVIYLRQGLYSKRLATFARNDNDIQMAQIIARFEDELQADAVFVDGGHGTGIVSAGSTMGRGWHLIWFSAAPTDAGYLNKRAEIWGGIRAWLKAGGAIDPGDDVLYQDLIGPELIGRLDGRIQLESKEDMKDRGQPSPNRADALALTFAFPVAKKQRGNGWHGAAAVAEVDYDPFAQR